MLKVVLLCTVATFNFLLDKLFKSIIFVELTKTKRELVMFKDIGRCG